MWRPRKHGFSIGRLVTASPTEGERYYLRLLLNNVKGAESFEDLKIYNNVRVSSFREAAFLRGLLQADNNLQLCMQEAASYQMPAALRRLFATILVYCNPIDARLLWEQFEPAMSEDFIRVFGITKEGIKFKALATIGRQLESMGKNINDYRLVDKDIVVNDSLKGLKEIDEELGLPISSEDIENISTLTMGQMNAFNTIIDRVLTEKATAFFIDGPGGTGKTYLYRSLLALVRSKGFIALATASSGIAASILPGGRTAHSRFKIPVNADDNIGCNISKQSGLAKLLRATRLIIWDEAPMVRRQSIEAFNRMLQDICESSLLFGGKVVVFGGDFRQVLHIVPKGTVQHAIDTSLVRSPLWPMLEKIRLTENMRARYDLDFSKFLLRVGDGNEQTLVDDSIILPPSMVIPHVDKDSLINLVTTTFPSLQKYVHDVDSVINRAILAPTNEIVDNINECLIDRFPGEAIEYISFDQPIDKSQVGFEEEFFNTLTPSGFPAHVLRLKPNSPIILLRNIDPSKGLCNGTCLICKRFEPNIIDAEIAVGNHKGNRVFLPRIPLLPAETENVAFPFQRTQFPIRLSFAMTINKAQGQTLDFVGIYLPQPVFSHGQLYVALSRARTSDCIKVLVEHPTFVHNDIVHTRNVVYQEVLALAAAS